MEGDATDAINAADAIDWENWLATLVMMLAEPTPLRSERFDEAMVVSFIERPPAQSAQPRQVPDSKHEASIDQRRLRAAPGDHEAAVAQISSDEEASAAPLRLHLEEDAWSTQQRVPDKTPWQRRADATREWEQPHVAGIEVRPPPSLKQRLALLGALFGSPPYDPCPQVESRLANPAQLHALHLQADLQTRERHCRP